jgi:hypothetical protein
MKKYTINWATQRVTKNPNIKVKDFSQTIPLRIDSRTVILIGVNDDPEKKREEYLRKHKLL